MNINNELMNTIQPRTLKGFRDFFGAELLARKQVLKIIEDTFKKYGYEALETPTLEYFDILMGKYGEEEKLVYNFEDFGGRKVALKYDLTVPTCRVLAQYPDKINLPWKRYQLQPVWRADNTQKGRFREFWQCDADIFGSSSIVTEAEYIKMGIELLEKLGFKDFKVMLNNRKILNAFAEYSGMPEKFNDIVAVLDKWEKRSQADSVQDFLARGLTQESVDKILTCVSSSLQELGGILATTQEGPQGIQELQSICNLVQSDKVAFVPTIARGLSYYTGPVWEWNITEGGVGSVGGGGRYDKLVGSFSGRDIPATGGSFGIERILEVMRDRNMLSNITSNVKVLVTIFSPEYIKNSFELASILREQGISAYIYPEVKPIGKQFEYASKKGIPFAVAIGENEVKDNLFTLKNMETREQESLSKEELIKKLI